MTAQELFVKFKETLTCKVALREFEGIIHAYPMRGVTHRQGKYERVVKAGMPLCNQDIRFMQSSFTPTADAPTCKGCLVLMRSIVGKN